MNNPDNQQLQEKPLSDRRYIVGWEPVSGDRQLVFVVDKLAHRIVFEANVKDRFKKAYPSIKRIYGESECIPGKPMRISLFK